MAQEEVELKETLKQQAKLKKTAMPNKRPPPGMRPVCTISTSTSGPGKTATRRPELKSLTVAVGRWRED